MISSGGSISVQELNETEFDILIFGLGFETRSTFLAAKANARRKIALKLPRLPIHSYDRNVRYAEAQKHVIIDDIEQFTLTILPKMINRAEYPLTIAFDISSINRFMLFEVLFVLLKNCRPTDRLKILYCPAKFSKPGRTFPQIERLGPISGHFSSYNADTTKPLCLMLGLGFEPGIAMGIIGQLEPRISYCFWGSGIDGRFDDAVRKANFNFNFSSFATREVRYLVDDPKGSFDLLEGITYGLMQEYNIVLAPQGPKLFSLLSALIGIKYSGQIAIWRVQQNREHAADSFPQNRVIYADIDLALASTDQVTKSSDQAFD